ncbi:hypothetical protein GCM10023194_78530 [Planotetraspora phitsanulokensis]|uniref:DUF305 domain-containing protein n=1 Tax=Planotetraspora phitsanulokensis TaxID=575192 RepID=A0A8J3U9B5_9ACTN|nr:DUF305 domain-containing protein [Planotetraspora phitsanulokensis]GII41139.1 hypothetical protein Pph01_61420 [Planotetraspora phitsanulokensis]
MRAVTVGAPLLAMITVLLVARCVAAGPTSSAASHDHHPQEATSAVSAAAATPSGSFNATDVAWLQLMIPMTEQAVRLLDLAPDKTADPRITRLSRSLSADHRAELQRLRDLLDRSGVPYVNVHEGHNIPGMVTADELKVITESKGDAFDRLFAEHTRDYLKQSVLVAQGEQGAGADGDTKAFAAAMAKAHAGELTRLTALGE